MASYPRFAALAIAALAVVATGCGSSSSSSGAAAPSSPSSGPANASTTTTTGSASTITIKNFAFGDPITVKSGATVTVHNADDTAHTVTAADGSFNTNPIFAGTSKTFVAPTKPGVYKFHCNIHANMQGTLTVTG